MGNLRSQRPPQPDISVRQASLFAYQRGLRELAKYAPDVQGKLKLRVFETFDRLMRHRGMAGLARGLSLLDLGSADGTFVAICRERGIDAVGVDAEEGIDLERDVLPYRDGSIDVVTAISVVEHLSSASQLLRESYRVLKPGGAIIIVCPNWRYSWRAFYDDPTHVHPYTERSLARVLANHGFRDLAVMPWIVKKPSWMWDMPGAFFFARWLIPFRGDAPRFIPAFLKGKSSSLLGFARRPAEP